jgi:peptidoglycan/LPS O-acetylase OafA/YrhL
MEAPTAAIPDVYTEVARPTIARKSSPRYMPGLDVIRGIAILLVLLYHGYADHHMIFVLIGTRSAHILARLLSLCTMGVPLFFILSGFLISGILIDTRATSDYFSNFYLRRALRIIPAYVAMLAVLVLTRTITPRFLIACLLYLCNMTSLFGVRTQYGPLWSLSVEEQFYLIWPLVVRKLSIRHLAIVSVVLLFFTPLLRLGLLYGPVQLHDIYFKTWDVMDFFASGCCMALAARSPRFRPYMAKAILPCLVSGLVLFFLPGWFHSTNPAVSKIYSALSPDSFLLFFSGLMLFAYVRPGIASLTIARPLVFLGNISYGLYLCHLFIFELIQGHWPAKLTGNLSMASAGLVQFAVQVTAAIAVATISRYTFEEFFLRMKPKHHAAAPSQMSLEEIT